MKISTTQRHYAMAALFLLVAFFFWARFIRNSMDASTAGELAVAVEESGRAEGDPAVWKGLFAKGASRRGDFAVIRDSNVFSPARRAYVPEAQTEAAQGSVRTPEPAERGDVHLLGVGLMAGDRKVILRVFSSGRGVTQFYGEGDYVDGSEGGSGPLFRVLEIGDRFVRLEDRAGREFDVFLFGRDRVEEEEIDDSIYTTPTPMFIVGDDGEESVDESEDDESYSEYVSEEEERRIQRLVEEGKLEIIETPFGPVYRKLEEKVE